MKPKHNDLVHPTSNTYLSSSHRRALDLNGRGSRFNTLYGNILLLLLKKLLEDACVILRFTSGVTPADGSGAFLIHILADVSTSIGGGGLELEPTTVRAASTTLYHSATSARILKFCCLMFLFSHSEASHANVAIIANFGYFVKIPIGF